MSISARLGLTFAAFMGLVLAGCGTLTIQPTKAGNGIDRSVGTFRESDADRYVIVTMTDAVHEQLVRGERVDREGELPPLYAAFLANLARTYGMRRVADWPLSTLGIRCFVFELPDAGQRDATLAALRGEQFVETAQQMSTFVTSSTETASATLTGNDPYRELQHGFAEMDVAGAQRWATGKSVKVAIIDTGVDTRHPELKDRIVGIRNFVDRNANAFNNDVHGTAMAGVIAAASNNGEGLVGVAPEADLFGFKACWQADATAHCSTFTLAKALNFAIDQGVDVINLSLGGPADPLLSRLVDEALSRNIIVVGAASPKWPGGFPAGVKGIIAVTDATSDDTQTGFVKAPGNQVISTKPARQYDFYSGSSLATAHVTGVAALIRQRKPHLQANVVKDLILATATPGSHEANACRALTRLVGTGTCDAQAAQQ